MGFHSNCASTEIQKEANGLIAAGTWNYEEVVPRRELERMALQKGEKNQYRAVVMEARRRSSAKKRKARTVFRGDSVKDELGQRAIFQDIKVTPTARYIWSKRTCPVRMSRREHNNTK